MSAVIHGIISEIDVPFPIPNADACLDEDSGIKCPLVANTENNYHLSLPVKREYPSVIFILINSNICILKNYIFLYTCICIMHIIKDV